jgi:hypothetical protein
MDGKVKAREISQGVAEDYHMTVDYDVNARGARGECINVAGN